MSDIVIKVENLSKQYQLGQVGTGTLTRDLQRWYSRIRGKEDPTLKIGQENILSAHRTPLTASHASEFVWALKDINFEVKQGEVLGIIGKNGAGKSTLLKILSQVTSPTTGEIKVKGRIASLLEVGTGFHPELTGRENVFLNGAILGMTKREIRSKFDEIVDFSGVEKYIDTPVKRYSSGMYVRLAFAVAAHLEPEILVVDEVLAVGDAEFQKKALGKMQDLSQGQGRTVIFVSHNLSSIRNLCKNGILLKNGSVSDIGTIENVLNAYVEEREYSSKSSLIDIKARTGNGLLTFVDVDYIDKNGGKKDVFEVGESMIIKIYYKTKIELENCQNSRIAIGINDLYGNRITTLCSSVYIDKIDVSKQSIQFEIERLFLNEGVYSINLFCETTQGIADWFTNVFKFRTILSDFYKTGRNLPIIQGNLITSYKVK